MNRYTITRAAREDLDRIWDYIGIEQDNPAAADRLIGSFADKFRLLAE